MLRIMIISCQLGALRLHYTLLLNFIIRLQPAIYHLSAAPPSPPSLLFQALEQRTFTIQFQVVQWYETNLVLHSRVPLTDPQHLFVSASKMQVEFASASRTLALQGTKHILSIISWFRSSAADMAFNTFLNSSASATLPFIMAPAPLLEDNLFLVSPAHNSTLPPHQEIEVVVSVASRVTPSTFSVQLYLGETRAVRVFPEWQLPPVVVCVYVRM